MRSKKKEEARKQVMLHLKELQADRKPEKEGRSESLCIRGQVGRRRVRTVFKGKIWCAVLLLTLHGGDPVLGTQITNPTGGNPGDIFVVIKFPESKGI